MNKPHATYAHTLISAITERAFAGIKALSLFAIAVVLVGGPAAATTYYYDTSASAGLGGTPPIGSWASGANAEWTTDPTGSTTPTTASWATGTFNDAVFDGTAATLAITASPGVFVNSITVNQNYTLGTGTTQPLTLQNQAKIIVASGKTAIFNGLMQGTAGYNISGGGTFDIANSAGSITGAVSVTGGSTLELVSSGAIGGTGVGAGDVTLDNGTLRNDGTGAAAFLTTNRNIILGGGGGTVNVALNSSAILTYNGVISGTGNTLHKSGAGEFRVAGAQTFGNLNVDQGFYYLNSTGGVETGLGAVTNTVTVADGAAVGTGVTISSPSTRSFSLGTGSNGAGFLIPVAVTWTIAGNITGGNGLVLNPTGQANSASASSILTLSGTNSYTGSTTINLGTLIASGGSAIPDGSQVKLPTSGSSTAVFQVNTSETIGSLSGGLSTSGSVTLNSSGVTLTAGGDNSSTSYGGNVTGTGTFQKAGSGTMTISQDWTNTGGVVINAGTIKYGTGAAGFATTVPVSINNGGTLDMNSIGDTFGSLNSTAGQTTGVVSMGSGNTLHLGQTATTGRSYDGKITGSGTLDKAGSTFTQTLNGDNSGFTGPITITLGKIAVGNVNALGTTAGNTAVASGAELLFDGAAHSYTIAEPISIAGAGADGGAITVQNSSNTNLSGPITLTADATVTTSSTATATYSNANAFTANNFNLTLQGGSGTGGGGTVSGAIVLGTGSLTKAQGGKWVLTADNTYSGGTTINASGGTLLANNSTGSATGSGPVTVNGGTFGGTGNVTGAVTVNAGGTISPGASIGQFNVGALSFVGANAALKSEIDSTFGVNLASAADLLNVNGNLSIGAGAKLNLVDVGSPNNVFAGDTKFTLISYSGTWDGGTFTGAADDSIVSVGLNQYVINYDDTSGGSNFGGGAYSNYVTLTAVPEVNASLLGGLVTLVLGLAIGGRKLFQKVASA